MISRPTHQEKRKKLLDESKAVTVISSLSCTG